MASARNSRENEFSQKTCFRKFQLPLIYLRRQSLAVDLDQASIGAGLLIGAGYGLVTDDEGKLKYFKIGKSGVYGYTGDFLIFEIARAGDKYSTQAGVSALPAYLAAQKASDKFGVPPVLSIGVGKATEYIKDSLGSSIEVEKVEEELENSEEALSEMKQELENQEN